MNTISKKMKYIHTDGWRGYEEPINAVCGANDTGTYDDSPCNSYDCQDELNKVKKILRANNIKYKSHWGKTSNVFCIHRYVLTAPEFKDKARALIQPLIPQTKLLYICN